MKCEHCGFRRALRGLIVCKQCLRLGELEALKP